MLGGPAPISYTDIVNAFARATGTTPQVNKVAPGTPIEFKNADPFEHRLYAMDVPDFVAADTADGGSRQWVAPASGSFEIRDEVTPSFQMWVVVEPNVVSTAYPNIMGVFDMQSELPGMHKLQAYFAGKPVGKPFAFKILDRDMDVSGAPLNVAPPKKAKK